MAKQPHSKTGRGTRTSRRSVLGAAVAGIASPLLLATEGSAQAKDVTMPEYIPIELVPTQTAPPPPPPSPYPSIPLARHRPPFYVRPGRFIYFSVELDKPAPEDGYQVKIEFDNQDPLEPGHGVRHIRFEKCEKWAWTKVPIKSLPNLVGILIINVTVTGGRGGTGMVTREVRVTHNIPSGAEQ